GSYASTASAFGTSTNNVDFTASTPVTTAAVTINSIRFADATFNSGNPTLTLTGALTITSGGILVSSAMTTPANGRPGITGSSITTATSSVDLIVQQFSGTPFTIASTITGTGALTKSGGGTLILSGTQSYTGSTYINQGVLQWNSTTAIPTGNVIFGNGST